MSITRDFLGWEQPFGVVALDWLWERKEELPGMLIVVPTAQSGRRLRESLAERGAVLGPQVVTAGVLMWPEDFAPEAVDVLAWVEILEEVEDWTHYEELFPVAPGEGESAGWALGLAKSLMGVRVHLQENGLTFASAAQKMGGSLEAERWRALAELEEKVESRLADWGFASKSAQLAEDAVTLPEGVEQVVIAGVFDLPPVSVRVLEKSGVPVTVLIAGNDEGDFDEWGRPLEVWGDREITWPQKGSVNLTGDPRQQAELALRHIAERGCSSAEVAFGTGDEEVARELVRTFGRSGWVVHDPGAGSPPLLASWLSCWKNYLRTAGVAEAIDLLAFPQSGVMVKGKRALRASALSQLRDQWLVRDAEDLARVHQRITHEVEESANERKKRRLAAHLENAVLGHETMESLTEWRESFLKRGFHAGMRSLLKIIDPDHESGMLDWLDETAAVAKHVKRSPGFWIELLLASVSPIPAAAPEDRVLDVQGWLELLYHPAPHLVICGMNEGKISSPASQDSWLPEATRVRLGLTHDRIRAARDAYLLTALLKSRAEQGQVDLIVGKSSTGGEMLKPSRLLLAAKGEELAHRVKQLFAEVEPVDAGVAWTLEDHWKWHPREETPKERISVTAFAKYLACPFRYYLERVMGMSRSDSERAEWNSRDFGTVMHEVLERWGLDEEAREFAEASVIEQWVHRALDEIVAERFGEVLPLAVRLQAEAMRQRLTWFAQVQAEERTAGWHVVEVEKDFSLVIGGVEVTGQVDRIDRHEDGRIRVLDYKTSRKAKKVTEEHLRNLPKHLPEHLEGVEDVLTPAGKLWTNVQVPFYAAALEQVDEVGYFALGETEVDVKISLWEDFGEAEKDSAVRCAEWVLSQVRAKVFWPPAERPRYDEFEELSYGRLLQGAVNWEGGVS